MVVGKGLRTGTGRSAAQVAQAASASRSVKVVVESRAASTSPRASPRNRRPCPSVDFDVSGLFCEAFCRGGVRDLYFLMYCVATPVLSTLPMHAVILLARARVCSPAVSAAPEHTMMCAPPVLSTSPSVQYTAPSVQYTALQPYSPLSNALFLWHLAPPATRLRVAAVRYRRLDRSRCQSPRRTLPHAHTVAHSHSHTRSRQRDIFCHATTCTSAAAHTFTVRLALLHQLRPV